MKSIVLYPLYKLYINYLYILNNKRKSNKIALKCYLIVLKFYLIVLKCYLIVLKCYSIVLRYI